MTSTNPWPRASTNVNLLTEQFYSKSTSKAFDMLYHEKLINTTSLPNSLKRWFNCYLHGRQSRVSFCNTTSSARNVKPEFHRERSYLPYCSIFTFLTFPPPTQAGVNVVQYADDISVYSSDTALEQCAIVLTFI